MTREQAIEVLNGLVPKLRELGVAKFHGLGVSIELGPAPVQPVTGTDAKPDKDPVCPCGHDFAAHNEAGCLEGCSIERCGSVLDKEPT